MLKIINLSYKNNKRLFYYISKDIVNRDLIKTKN